MSVVLIFVLGLALGSFINVLIDRLPQGETVFFGRSRCDFCGKTLAWFELVPIVSFLIQGGRCRKCHRKLSLQYPLVELFSGIGLITLFQLFAVSPILLLAYGLIFGSLLVIFVADLKYQIIPDSLLGVGLLGTIIKFFAGSQLVIVNYLAAAALAALFFYFLYLVTAGRGLGLGDVKLAFLLGLLLGFPQLILAFYLAFLTGAGMGVILILSGKKSLKSKIAFGPFLILGYVVTLAFGDRLIFWFLKLV